MEDKPESSSAQTLNAGSVLHIFRPCSLYTFRPCSLLTSHLTSPHLILHGINSAVLLTEV